MKNRIDEELRQYKLFKIQETESKLRRFQEKYDEIKEHLVIKFSKNLTSNILGITLLIFAILSLKIGVWFLFPDKIIDLFKLFNNNISKSDIKDLFKIIPSYIFSLFFIIISLILVTFSYLLKVNNKKRNHIYSLSKLLEEVMLYMEQTRDDDKKKYEQFVDLIAEQEQRKKNI